jgi:PAP2 superfamily
MLKVVLHRLTLIALALSFTGRAHAQNAVTDWSLKSAAAITAVRAPASSVYFLALVHGAMYDAAVAVDPRYEPFRVRVHARKPASERAAIVAAAYHVLHERLPGLEPALTGDYTAYLATIADGPAKRNGLTLGETVARQWLASRVADGFDQAVEYVQVPPGPGIWEPTAPSAPVDVVMTRVLPYVLVSNDEFRPDGPPALTSDTYATDFQEIQALGRADSTLRTPEQTEIARFWNEHAAAQWNRNLSRLAIDADLDLTDSARLLAMTHVAGADALVSCFDAKYHYRLWRPLHAVQRADTDRNAATDADPTWTALLNVNHPEYPSGHACASAAITETAAAYFGSDTRDIVLDSTASPTPHYYGSFSAIVREVADARIFGGLHFRFSTIDGAEIGHRVAERVASRYFQPCRHR